MRVLLVGSILHIIAGFFAALIARRRRDYWPVAIFISVTALVDLALIGLTVGASTELPAAPLTGLARFVGHLRQGLWLVWPVGFAAMAQAVFTGRRSWAFPAAYVGTLAVLVLGYPTISGETLRRAYLGIELAALAVAVGALVQWARRREFPTLTHNVTILLMSSEVAVLIGPWLHDIFGDWDASRIMYTATYAAAVLLQGGVLWWRSRSRSS